MQTQMDKLHANLSAPEQAFHALKVIIKNLTERTDDRGVVALEQARVLQKTLSAAWEEARKPYPFPLPECKECDLLDSLLMEDIEDEFEAMHREICTFPECSSMRPSSCPRIATVVTRQEGQEN